MFSQRISLALGLTAIALTAGVSTASAETLSISDGTVVTEGAAGDHVKATFIITRHRESGESDQGGYGVTISDGSAKADTDYFGGGGGSGFAGNNPCQAPEGCTDSDPFEVELIGDAVPEPDEHFFVNINSLTMVVLDGQGEGTILDDDGFVAPEAPAPALAPAPIPAPAPKPVTVAAPQQVAAPAPAAATTTATPLAAADDETGPRIGMIFRGLRGSTARVRVQCPSDERRCVGRLAVQLNEKTMASAPFRLRGGETRLLRVHLTRKQRRTLHRAGVVYLKASAFDAAGNRLVRVLSFQI